MPSAEPAPACSASISIDCGSCRLIPIGCCIVDHLLSTDANRITLQLYVGVIAMLQMYLRTGQRPSRYTCDVLQLIARSNANLSRVPEVLERIERERELERARLSRKKKLKV